MTSTSDKYLKFSKTFYFAEYTQEAYSARLLTSTTTILFSVMALGQLSLFTLRPFQTLLKIANLVW